MRRRTWPIVRKHRLAMASRHPSSSNTRRRRMLLWEASSPSLEAVPELEPVPEPVTPVELVAPTELGPAISPVVMLTRSESDATFDRSFSAADLEIPRTIPHLVSSPVPVSWLFVGDSFTAKDVTEPPAWRVYTTRFSAVVRSHFQRPKDVFIDATFPSARLSEVMFDFERRIAKFEPDICFLSLSILEAEAKSVDRFEKMLVRLIRWSKKFDCQLVIQTPPCLPSRSDAELTRRLILIETIRGIAAEQTIPLVDHWEHWEWANSPVGHTDSWFDAQTHTPAEQGHRQLAQRLVQDLKLNDVAKPDFPLSIEESAALYE